VRTGKWLAALLAAGAIFGAIFTASSSGSPGSRPRVVKIALSAPPGTPVLRIGGFAPAPPVASGFVGLSMEFSALTAYAGHDPEALDPVFEQLIRNLAPGQQPVLRIGGDSTDRTWVPVPGMAKPAGIRYTVTPGWLQVAGALARALDARMIVGINLEVDSPRVAGAEGQAMLAAIGAPWLQALELGNEPELYGTFPWYRRNGHGVTGRPKTWNVASYLRDISKITRALPGVPLAAPATGSANWITALGRIAAAEPRMAVATVHRYPLDRCFTARSSPQYPTIPNLLAPASSDGLAQSVVAFANTAHAHRLAVRVDEFNSVSCSGKRGVSDTFASALWALDATFAMARAGVDGVNVHTFPGAIYQPFRLRYQDGAWQAGVRPEYYGLMMFAQAAPAGARLLNVSGSASGVRPWATRAPDGAVHVVLINDALHSPRSVAVRIPMAAGPAALEWLRAPTVTSPSGVTLGGQSFGDQTTTGVLAGPAAGYQVEPVGGRYVVRLPAASAAMLTLVPGSSPLKR
jgi:hypothetical protein